MSDEIQLYHREREQRDVRRAEIDARLAELDAAEEPERDRLLAERALLDEADATPEPTPEPVQEPTPTPEEQPVVEPEPAFVAQPHHRDGGDGLADGTEPVLDVGVRLGHFSAPGRPREPAVPDDPGHEVPPQTPPEPPVPETVVGESP